MTEDPRDSSVLIRPNAYRISRGLPRLLFGLGVAQLLIVAVVSPDDVLKSLGFAAAIAALACGFVLVRRFALWRKSRRLAFTKGQMRSIPLFVRGGNASRFTPSGFAPIGTLDEA